MTDAGETVQASRSVTPSRQAKIIILVTFTAGIGAFFYFDLQHYVSFDTVKQNRDKLLSFTEDHYGTGVALYIMAYIVQTALSLPGGAVMSVLGGFLFGALPATIYVNLGATTGAMLAFLASRYLLRDWVERKFGDRLGSVQAGFSKNAFSYLITLRLIPLFPFFLVNLVSGLTRVNVGTYVIATALGIIPATFVFAYAGRQLGTINSPGEILSFRVLLALTLLGLLMLVPVIYKKLFHGKV